MKQAPKSGGHYLSAGVPHARLLSYIKNSSIFLNLTLTAHELNLIRLTPRKPEPNTITCRGSFSTVSDISAIKTLRKSSKDTKIEQFKKQVRRCAVFIHQC